MFITFCGCCLRTPNKNAHTRSTHTIPAGVKQRYVTREPLSLRHRLSTLPLWVPSDSTLEMKWLSAFQIHCKQYTTTRSRTHTTDSIVSKGSWRSYMNTPSFRTALFQLPPLPHTVCVLLPHAAEGTLSVLFWAWLSLLSMVTSVLFPAMKYQLSVFQWKLFHWAFIIILYFDFK